ncbi:predicted protein [Naegleria gruberi]|uniref:Predicted protein n=1 Tax=Naegleria gruberi TaxID=5762 RepID=D2VTW4_NAEGR|nr:uncharacterized protein NAEGRDRAFT_81203 [Naegleria gruberi]EFC39793.1 predicted protein [Naegleria gruberi]|eukprot:XP_002672537.1 predicted protein [Naegleria gruberi strain NEG-M]
MSYYNVNDSFLWFLKWFRPNFVGSLEESLKELKKKLSTGNSQTAAWKKVIGIIFSLSTEDETAEELLEMGGISTLLELLHDSLDPRICGILLNVSNNDECREEIVAQGGVSEVCRLLKKKVDETLAVEYATGALLNLVQDEKSREDFIKYSNIFKILGQALENDLSTEAQTNSISLISNLIMDRAESIRDNEEMFSAIACGLNSLHSNIVSLSLNCVWNICVERDEEITRKLMNANILPALGEALSSLEGEDAGNCLVCMSMVMEHVDELTDDLKECIEEMIELVNCEDLKKATGASTAVWNISQNDYLASCISNKTLSSLSKLLESVLKEKDIKSVEKVLSCLVTLLTKEESMVEYFVNDRNGLIQVYKLLETEILSIPIYQEESTYRKCLDFSIMISCICSEIKEGEKALLEIGIVTELLDLITLKQVSTSNPKNI